MGAGLEEKEAGRVWSGYIYERINLKKKKFISIWGDEREGEICVIVL